MTFWQEARWQWKQVWTNPYWYFALLLFVWGPFLNSKGFRFAEYPWWAWVYMPLMIPTIFLLGLAHRRTQDRLIRKIEGSGPGS